METACKGQVVHRRLLLHHRPTQVCLESFLRVCLVSQSLSCVCRFFNTALSSEMPHPALSADLAL